jgi:hypothetical protein
MATSEIRFRVLDVGQGACNYVEIVDGAKVTRNLLIDLGTNSSQKIAAKNLKLLREKIVAQGCHLDVLVLTHGDTDHYNMIAKILPAFGLPANNTQIGMVRYGGPEWRYGQNLIATLKKYTQRKDPLKPVSRTNPVNVASFTAKETSYQEVAMGQFAWLPLWKVDDVKLQLIIANTAHPKDPKNLATKVSMNAEAVNTKSVVLGLEWAGKWIVATGDATATTIEKINELLKDASGLPKTFMLTMPHHGSRKTTYDLRNANDPVGVDDTAWEEVDKFLKIFKPDTVSVSAGEKRHHHPSMLMANQFASHTKQDKVYWYDGVQLPSFRHFITCWVDLKVTADGVTPAWPTGPKWLYATTQTASNVYSTFYFRNDPYNTNVAPTKKKKGEPPAKKVKTAAELYQRYLCPPKPPPTTDVSGTTAAIGIPMGRNWIFSMFQTTVQLVSEENKSRALAESPDLLIADRTPPPGFSTAAGRLTRAALAAPGPGALQLRPSAPRSIAQSAGLRLRGLRVIA